MKVEEIRKVMDFLEEKLDLSVGLTPAEWIDVLDGIEDKYGKNADVTEKRVEDEY